MKKFLIVVGVLLLAATVASGSFYVTFCGGGHHGLC